MSVVDEEIKETDKYPAPDKVPSGNAREHYSAGDNLDPPDATIDLLAVAMNLWSERRTIGFSGLIGLIVAVVFAIVLPANYTATASFIPSPSSGTSSSGLAASLSALSGGGAASLLGGVKTPSELYIGILKSRSVADKLINHFSLMAVYREKKLSRTEKKLAKKTTFESDPKSPIITISFTDHNAGRARDVVSSYLKELALTSGRLALSESSQRRLFFEQRLAQEKNALADAEVDLKQSQEKTGLVAPSVQTAAEIQTITQLRAQISGRRVELAAMRQASTDENPNVIRLQSEISDLEAQLDRMQRGSRQDAVSGTSTAQLPSLALEYIRKAREVKYHEALFEIIAKQYEAARLDEADHPPIVQTLDEAAFPDMRSGPPRTLISLAGLLLGLLGSCVYVLLKTSKLFAQGGRA